MLDSKAGTVERKGIYMEMTLPPLFLHTGLTVLKIVQKRKEKASELCSGLFSQALL